MKVLVLGGTGSIGTPVVEALIRHRHEVLGLARTDAAADRLSSKGAQPVRGDIRSPQEWAGVVESVDAAIQLAGDLADAESLGRNLISVLLNTVSGKT